MTLDDVRIASEIRALLSERASGASICPSEVARRLHTSPAWRDAMADVRRVAKALALDGVVRITQSDAVLDPDAPIVGPIRLRRGGRWEDDGIPD
ncbi:DUF3253 domain-containing protein [Luteimonas terrae]|uniref:DUF3253 domain-containing protein n=1 Tax=Luteimonas terrae TaxID=1530191 RepID=A0ABU1XYR5_9GAMM|nr:DUF3253 domain-containing protein [Luteimonas terrae]MDR7193936.1 hypothetical protein [Luteimonas terrae]